MDHKSVYLQKHQVPELIDSLICKLVDAMPANPKQFLADQLAAQSDAKYPVQDHMPQYASGSAARYPVAIAGVLTADNYGKLRERKTTAGVSLDACLEDGVEYNCNEVAPEDGKALPEIPGLLAGDEECFSLFGELFDKVIAQRNGGKAPAFKHDTSVGKVSGGATFDEQYVIAACLRLRRNFSGFRFLPAISRAERKNIGPFVAAQCKAAFPSGSPYAGSYVDFAISKDLPPVAGTLGILPTRSAWVRRANLEWPKGRGVFVGTNNDFFIVVNGGEEHVEFVQVASNGPNLREAFEKVYEAAGQLGETCRKAGHAFAMSDNLGALTANLQYLGSGLIVQVMMKIPKLSNHPQFAGILEKMHMVKLDIANDGVHTHVASKGVLSQTETDLLSATITAVTKFVELEQLLEKNQEISGKY